MPYCKNDIKNRIKEVEEAVKNNFSVAGVLKQLGLIVAGGNYKTIKHYIKLYNIDTSHFGGKSWIKGKNVTTNPGKSLKEILIQNSTYTNTNSLKKRLLKENIFINQCSECGIKNWQNKILILHLDHINGINDDHRLENLRLLCPNCHSQTTTYCRKNIGFFTEIKNNNLNLDLSEQERENILNKNSNPILSLKIKKENLKKEKKKYYCLDCNIEIDNGSKRCQKCYHITQKGKFVPTKIEWPSKEDLEKMIWEISTLQLSLKLGVSDSAIAKRCRKLGIKKPPRGHWSQGRFSKS